MFGPTKSILKIGIVICYTGILLGILVKNVSGFEDKIVAIVNDEIITKSDINKSGVEGTDIISDIAEKKLQLQIAKNLGISGDVGIEGENNPKKMSKEDIIISRLINMKIRPEISIREEDIKKYYLIHKDRFENPEEVRIGYIFIPFSVREDIIKDIIDNLKKDTSLKEIKNRLSIDDSIRVMEDLGFVKRDSLLPELNHIVFNMKKGEVSAPVKTKNGTYIVKILDRRSGGYKPYERVKEEIRVRLFREKMESLYVKWLFNIKGHSFIEIRNF